MNRVLYILLIGVSLSSCKGFFGDKTDLSFIDKPVYQGREVAYVPIQPVLDHFIKPTQVVMGFDQVFYVVDEGSSDIISFDLSGRELNRIKIPGLKGMAVDRSLDLLAIGTYDTTILVGGDSTKGALSCIYRINQSNNGLLGLQFGKAKAIIIHPFYLKKTAIPLDQEVSFKGIGSLGDNTYYITRTGPDQNNLKLGGPDDAVLQVRPDLNTG